MHQSEISLDAVAFDDVHKENFQIRWLQDG